MIWGLTNEAFTRVHVLVSLAGIVPGLIVLFGLLARKRLDGWTAGRCSFCSSSFS